MTKRALLRYYAAIWNGERVRLGATVLLPWALAALVFAAAFWIAGW